MRKVKVKGSARMKQLGHVKLEVWFSPAQMKALQELAGKLGLSKTCLGRRAINYVVRGGENAAYPLRGFGYD